MPTWAVVGATPDPAKPSHYVPRFLQDHGRTVVPVNPAYPEVLGATCWPSLDAVPTPVDVVDMFRRSSQVGVHVDEAIAMGAKAVWLQLGVIDEAAAARAREAGLLVVMDRCPMIEWPRYGSPV
jgi:predicted CoA-binding protein